MKLIVTIILVVYSVNAVSQNPSCACCTDSHAEFDFWIGEWEVSNTDGTLAGTNSIKKTQDNCIIEENWISSAQGYTGTSTNFFNLQTRQWEQLWIDNQGVSLHLKGKRIADKMILQSENFTNDKGQVYFHKITWTSNDDGTVRQLWETITNNSQITIAFDGLYKRLKQN